MNGYGFRTDAELRQEILLLARLRSAIGDIPPETTDVWEEVRRRERLAAICEEELLAAAEELTRRLEIERLCGSGAGTQLERAADRAQPKETRR